MHAPTMGTTLGTGCVLIASMLVSSALLGRPVLHEVLLALFLVITTPITAILLTRAAIYRGAGAIDRAKQARETRSGQHVAARGRLTRGDVQPVPIRSRRVPRPRARDDFAQLAEPQHRAADGSTQ